MRDLVSSPAMGVSTLEPEVWCGRENSSGSARSMEATDASRLGVSSWFRIKNTHSLTHAAHPRSEEGEQELGRLQNYPALAGN